MGRARKRFNWKARQQIKTIESADQPKNEVSKIIMEKKQFCLYFQVN